MKIANDSNMTFKIYNYNTTPKLIHYKASSCILTIVKMQDKSVHVYIVLFNLLPKMIQSSNSSIIIIEDFN